MAGLNLLDMGRFGKPPKREEDITELHRKVAELELKKPKNRKKFNFDNLFTAPKNNDCMGMDKW